MLPRAGVLLLPAMDVPAESVVAHRRWGGARGRDGDIGYANLAGVTALFGCRRARGWRPLQDL